MKWSPQQEAVFQWFANPERKRAIVRARAGTGKTTTIVAGVQHAPEDKVLLCAFNKRIAEELQRKLPKGEAKTLHGVGFSFVRRNWTNCRPDENRGKRVALEACGPSAPDAMVALVARLSGLAKEMAPYAARWEDLQDVQDAMDCHPDEDWEDDGWTSAKVAQRAYRAMELAAERDGTCDFSDMLWLPLRHKWARGWYDLVVVDECQDMNAAQIELAQKVCRKGGRIIVVGDDRQAIYGFRGADSGSLDRLKVALGAEELPLTVTYRCPRKVVEEARALVPDYMAAQEAPEGTVSTMPADAVAGAVQPGDFVLSRANAPLVPLCLATLRRGVRATVAGRDVGKGLARVVKDLKPKSLPDFLAKLDRWEDREVKRAQKLKPERAERKVGEVQDKSETLRFLADGLAGVRELEERIASLFSDNGAGDAGRVVFSTIHRAKGLERPRTFVLMATLRRKDKSGKPVAPSLEEKNLEYVAYTRAQVELVKVG